MGYSWHNRPYMKFLQKKIIEFFQREWFLFVVIAVIGLLVFLFECL